MLTNCIVYDRIFLKIELCYSYQERWRERALWNPATCII